jgi:hypothetical protein
MNPRPLSTLSLTALVAVLATARPAHAYLDPSTGSMLLSAVIGLLATLALALKTFWYRLRALFRRADQPPWDGSSQPLTPAPSTDGDSRAPR